MKARHIIFPALFTAAVALSSCGGDGNTSNDIKAADSPAIDSIMPAHVQDPSTAFPQPPVTGTQTDSGGATDTARKKDTTQVRGN